MGEFFHGWKRQVGVVTLVMACVFAAGWVRSRITVDRINLPIRILGEAPTITVVLNSLYSAKGTVVWVSSQDSSPDTDVEEVRWSASDRPFWDTSSDVNAADDSDLPCRWRFLGFSMCELTEAHFEATYLFVPYWSFAIPLTLLSAWSFFSRPRKPRPPTQIIPGTAN